MRDKLQGNKKTHGKKQSEAGFTLMETMVVTFLFPMLFLTVYSTLDMSRVIFNTNSVFATLNQSAMQTLRSISWEIRQTSPQAVGHLVLDTVNNNTRVRFQIPVDCDNDNDVIGPNCDNQYSTSGPIQWGAYDQAGETQQGGGGNPLNRWVIYYVDDTDPANNQLVRDVLANNNPNSAIVALRRVVANNVSKCANEIFAFRAQPQAGNNNVLEMTICLSANDAVGQAGAARPFQARFSNNTLLRNAQN